MATNKELQAQVKELREELEAKTEELERREKLLDQWEESAAKRPPAPMLVAHGVDFCRQVASSARDRRQWRAERQRIAAAARRYGAHFRAAAGEGGDDDD